MGGRGDYVKVHRCSFAIPSNGHWDILVCLLTRCFVCIQIHRNEQYSSQEEGNNKNIYIYIPVACAIAVARIFFLFHKQKMVKLRRSKPLIPTAKPIVSLLMFLFPAREPTTEKERKHNIRLGS